MVEIIGSHIYVITKTLTPFFTGNKMLTENYLGAPWLKCMISIQSVQVVIGKDHEQILIESAA